MTATPSCYCRERTLQVSNDVETSATRLFLHPHWVFLILKLFIFLFCLSPPRLTSTSHSSDLIAVSPFPQNCSSPPPHPYPPFLSTTFSSSSLSGSVVSEIIHPSHPAVARRGRTISPRQSSNMCSLNVCSFSHNNKKKRKRKSS